MHVDYNFTKELQIEIERLIRVYCDNKPTINFVHNPVNMIGSNILKGVSSLSLLYYNWLFYFIYLCYSNVNMYS